MSWKIGIVARAYCAADENREIATEKSSLIVGRGFGSRKIAGPFLFPYSIDGALIATLEE